MLCRVDQKSILEEGEPVFVLECLEIIGGQLVVEFGLAGIDPDAFFQQGKRAFFVVIEEGLIVYVGELTNLRARSRQSSAAKNSTGSVTPPSECASWTIRPYGEEP